MNRPAELTFDAVDDLVAAQMRGKLGEASRLTFAPASIAPLVELVFSTTHDQNTTWLASPWLDRLSIRA